jgi:hypothetical protein
MQLTYDERVGAAYLRLREQDDDVGPVTSKTLRPPDAQASDDYFCPRLRFRGPTCRDRVPYSGGAASPQAFWLELIAGRDVRASHLASPLDDERQ